LSEGLLVKNRNQRKQKEQYKQCKNSPPRGSTGVRVRVRVRVIACFHSKPLVRWTLGQVTINLN